MALGVGLIGTGFIGKAHAVAWGSVRRIMGAELPPVRLELLCDVPAERARAMADQFGFARATDDWRALVADPAVDAVSICTPNALHREIASAALAAGKHVWCEKPMGLTLADAEAMAAAAAAAPGRVTLLGYNYVRNPAVRHARRLVAEGRIGRPVHFRGWVDEDYQADPDLPWTWRARIAEAGLGALGDLGCHLVALAVALMGEVESLIAETQLIHATRPLPGGGRAAVENEDVATALLRFRSGAMGSISASRSAWGRKNRLDFEVHGTKGQITFAQERMNELQLYVAEGPVAEQGFRTILSGPAHPPFGQFVPAPGHQLGFLDLKVIEAAEFLRAIGGGAGVDTDFAAGLHIERVIHGIAEAAAGDRRVRVAG
jgi:predicted dehydrogenase